jgi:hypothetical protein
MGQLLTIWVGMDIAQTRIMGLILLEITFGNLVWEFNIKDAGKKWKKMENMIIDRVIEYFVKLKWRLVVAWISNILYSLDSSVFALLKSIKKSGPVETTFFDSIEICLGAHLLNLKSCIDRSEMSK